MTAKSSINPMAVRNIRSTIRENKKLMIVICILHLLGIPMGSLALVIQYWLENLQRDSIYYSTYIDLSGYAVTAVCCLAAALLVGIAVATSVFQELWKKTRVDMTYSLPMTGSQRFFSHYLAGVIIYVLPYLAACILGWIILLTGGLVINFEDAAARQEYFEAVFTYFSMGSVGVLLLMVLYYTLTVLVVTCCGALFDSIYTTLLLNGLIPGTMAAVIGVAASTVSSFDFAYLWYPIGYTSPAGGLIYLLFLLDGNLLYSNSYGEVAASEATTHGMVPAFLRWAVVFALVIAAVLVLAWQLYKRRRAESIGQPFVYKMIYFVMLILLTVLILSLTSAGLTGAAILFAGIVFLIMEVIRKRGFRKFWLSILSYICVAAIVIGMFKVVEVTKVFGTAYRIPPASTVTSVKVEFSTEEYMDISLEYTDKDIIRRVQELHKDIIANEKEYGNSMTPVNDRLREADCKMLCYDYDEQSYYERYIYHLEDPEEMKMAERLQYDSYSYFTEEMLENLRFDYAYEKDLDITYYTASGSLVHRTYGINPDQYHTLLDIVWGTELYAQAYADSFHEYLESNNTIYDEDKKEHVLSQYGEINLELESVNHTVYFHCSEDVLQKLRDAYYEDMLTIKPTNTGGMYGEYHNLPIWNNCTRTIALLEDMGMKPFNTGEKIGYVDAENAMAHEAEYFGCSNYNSGMQVMDICLFAPEDIVYPSEKGAAYIGAEALYLRNGADFAYKDSYTMIYPEISMQELYPELYDLLSVAVRNQLMGDCYMLWINGEPWAIPQEHADLAEAVIAKGSGYAEAKNEDWEEYYNELYNTVYGDSYYGEYYDEFGNASGM